MKAGSNKVVSIDYTLKNDAGEILDQSTPDAPLHYLHGHNNLIAGLESALDGAAQGDNIVVSIPPAEAYGEHDETLIQEVPRGLFQGVDNIEPGMQFQAQGEGGVQVVRVTAVTDDTVTVDANHALAGQTLHFDVTVKDVRDASQEELDHGHVHGPGGHHH